jgi:hypothetical protein
VNVALLSVFMWTLKPISAAGDKAVVRGLHRRGVEIACLHPRTFHQPPRTGPAAHRATRGANQCSGALEMCAPSGAISH